MDENCSLSFAGKWPDLDLMVATAMNEPEQNKRQRKKLLENPNVSLLK